MTGQASFPYLKIAQLLLLAGVLAFLLYRVDLSAFIVLIRQIDLVAVGILLLLSVLLVLVSVLKWRVFIRFFGASPSLFRLFELYLLGYFASAFLPSQLAGDVIRSVKLGKGVGQRQAFISTFLERYTGIVAMVLLAVIALIVGPPVPSEVLVALSGIVILVLCLTALLFLVPENILAPVAARIPKFGGRVSRLHHGFRALRGERSIFLNAMLYSLLFHTLTVLNTAVAGYAVGWSAIPLLQLFVVLPLILVVGALPLTPSGLGIQEGAFYFFLTQIGASPEHAIAVALILRLKMYLLASIGGIVWLTDRRST